MPKRKTADTTPSPVPASDHLKRSTATKPKSTAAATHKRTPAKRATVSAETELPTTASAAVSVSQDAIARLAYSYWEARGHQGGSAEEDWLRAERELLSRTDR